MREISLMMRKTQRRREMAACCSVLQCVAVCCSVLQCVAVCCSVCNVLICVAVSCSKRDLSHAGKDTTPNSNVTMLQCVAVCCSVLQCVAVLFIL